MSSLGGFACLSVTMVRGRACVCCASMRERGLVYVCVLAGEWASTHRCGEIASACLREQQEEHECGDEIQNDIYKPEASAFRKDSTKRVKGV